MKRIGLKEMLYQLVTSILDKAVYHQYEAIAVLLVFHIETLALLLSSNFKWSGFDGAFLGLLTDYISLFNIRQLLEALSLPLISVSWLSIVAVMCAVVFALFAYNVYSLLVQAKRSVYNEIALSLLVGTFKFWSYTLAIPFLHSLIIAFKGGAVEIIISCVGLVLLVIPLVFDLYFLVEDNFVEQNYLCKFNSNMRLMNFIYCAILMVFNTYLNEAKYKLPVALIALLWQLTKIYRVFCIDYFFIRRIQKLQLWLVSAECSVSVMISVNALLLQIGYPPLNEIEASIFLLLIPRLVSNLYSRFLRRHYAKYDNLSHPAAADRLVKELFNATNIYQHKFEKEYDYGIKDLLSSDVIQHFGLLSVDFATGMDKRKYETFWRHNELYDPLTEEVIKPKWAKQRSKPIKNPPENIVGLKHFIVSVYQKSTAKFPKNNRLHLSFASFVLHYMRHVPITILECYILKRKLETGLPDLRLDISRRRLVTMVNNIQEELLRSSQDTTLCNLDIKGISELEDHYNVLINHINVFIKDYYKFLDLLSHETIMFSEIYQVGKNLITLRRKIDKVFFTYLSENPMSISKYGDFLSKIFLEEHTAIEFASKLQRLHSKTELYHRLEKDFYEIELMFSPSSCVLHVSGQKESLGKVLKSNAGCEVLFGYTIKELNAMNVKQLTPRLIELQHDRFLQRYLETGQENILYRNQRFFGRTKDGFIFPLGILVKPVVDQDTGFFLFLAYLKGINHGAEYILTDSYGLVDSMTPNVAKALGISPKTLQKSLVHIQLICPDITEFFEGRMMTSLSARMTDRSEASVYDIRRRKMKAKEDYRFEIIRQSDPSKYTVPYKGKSSNLVEFHSRIERCSMATGLEFQGDGLLEEEYVEKLNEKIGALRAEGLRTHQVDGSIEVLNTSPNAKVMYAFKLLDIEELLSEEERRQRKNKRMTSTTTKAKRRIIYYGKNGTRHSNTVHSESLNDVRRTLKTQPEQESLSRDANSQSQLGKTIYFNQDSALKDLPQINLLPPITNEYGAEEDKLEQSSRFEAEEFASDLLPSDSSMDVITQIDNLLNNPKPKTLEMCLQDKESKLHQELRKDEDKLPRIHLKWKDDGQLLSSRLSDNNLTTGFGEENTARQSGIHLDYYSANRNSELGAAGTGDMMPSSDENREPYFASLESARSNTQLNSSRVLLDQKLGVTPRNNELEDSNYKLSKVEELSFEAEAEVEVEEKKEEFKSDANILYAVDNQNQFQPKIKKKVTIVSKPDLLGVPLAHVDSIPQSFATYDSAAYVTSVNIEQTDSVNDENDRKDILAMVFHHLDRYIPPGGRKQAAAQKKIDIRRRASQQQDADKPSIGSSLTSSQYEARLINVAIKNNYVPLAFLQSRIAAVLGTTTFILAALIVLGIEFVEFQNLRQSADILDEVNRLAYNVHKIGSAALDLELLSHFERKNKTFESYVQKSRELHEREPIRRHDIVI